MKILPDEYSSFKQSLLANNSILVYSIPYTGIYFLFIDVKGSFIYIYKAISPKKNHSCIKLNIHVNVFVIKSKIKSTYSFLSKGVN